MAESLRRLLHVTVDEDTWQMLVRLGEEEYRSPKDQAAWMLRLAVKARLAQEQALRHLEGTTPLVTGEACA